MPPVQFHREDFDSLYLFQSITIAHWLIVLLYLLPWLGTMTWWHRRKRRLLDHASPLPGE